MERHYHEAIADLPITLNAIALRMEKTELIKAKENYYGLYREFIDLWSKIRRDERGAL